MDSNINNLILIVDDNPHNIQVLAAVVNHCNYKSGFAMNGKQALDFLEENIPALILLDVMMPDMNGYEVCEKIKQNPELRDIPVIFLTAKSEKDDIIKGFESGGVDYVTKPFSHHELKMRIKTHMELGQKKNELIELNKKLEASNTAKDKFFSIIAHDLRGPISSISQFMDFILDDIENIGKDELIEDLKMMKAMSRRSYELLENLLVWSLSQKGSIDYSPKLNNIYNLVESNIELFKHYADKKHIYLENKVNSKLEFVFDSNMINTVIRNLINNAIKYTEKEGKIIITSEENNNFVSITIKDDGVGIQDSKLENLFQIDKKKYSKEGTSGEKGSGLGLILCKEFIDKHNGSIKVESDIGKGSKFTFSLPKDIKSI